MEEHERVLGAGGGDDVGEAPGEGVRALLALVHGHHDAAAGGSGGMRGRGRCHVDRRQHRAGDDGFLDLIKLRVRIAVDAKAGREREEGGEDCVKEDEGAVPGAGVFLWVGFGAAAAGFGGK